MRCPACRGELEKAHPQWGLTIETCPACRGAFFDRGEIKIPMEGEGGAPSGRSCPKCGLEMSARRYYRTVSLDECPGCRGLWFKDGDIQALRQASGKTELSGPAAPAPRPDFTRPPGPGWTPDPAADDIDSLLGLGFGIDADPGDGGD